MKLSKASRNLINSERILFPPSKNPFKFQAPIIILVMNLFWSGKVLADSVDYELSEEEHLGTGHKGLETLESNLSRLDSSLNDFSPSEGSYQMMPIYGYVLSAAFLFTIWIVGTAGNFMVPYLVATNSQLQTPMNLFLVNLSVADFTMAAFGSPISFSAAVLGGWPFGDTGCVIYGFGMALGGITSITTLMFLAFERFMMIARPFRAADLQNKHSITLILVIWIYSLGLTVPPLLGWASYGPEAAHISCSVSWEKDDVGTTSYIIFLFTLGLAVPLITILGSYMGILITIRQAGQSQSGPSATRRAELRVIGMVATMVTSFMVAWSPYAILSLIVAFSPNMRKEITPFVAVLPSIFVKSSSCYNPFIYVGLNTQFRAAWLKLLGLQRPNDEDGGTALTMSATHLNANDKDRDDHKVETSFMRKNHRGSKSDKEMLPLLNSNSPAKIESPNPAHRQSHPHSDILGNESETDQIPTGLSDPIKSSSMESPREQAHLLDEDKSKTIPNRPVSFGKNGESSSTNKSSNVKFVDGR